MSKRASRVKPIKPVRKRRKRRERKPEEVTTSKAELNFMAFLLSIGLQVEQQHKVGRKFYDFIVRGTKILIEFNGDYWHCNPEIYPKGPINKMQRKNMLNDLRKRTIAKNNGYEVITVWEKEFNTRKAEVKARLMSELKEHITGNKQPEAK